MPAWLVHTAGAAQQGQDPGGVAGVAIRDLVRQLARDHGAQRLHLFLAVPHGLALLLGHLWDRMPPTLLYEDLGAGNAYQPAFLIPN